jgi:hypothetical protein
MISKLAAKRIFEIYVDEMVTVYLRDMNIISVAENQQEVKISPMVEGLVVDVDTEYIYLGMPDGSILKTIPHQSVGLIEITFVAELIDADMAQSDDEVH